VTEVIFSIDPHQNENGPPGVILQVMYAKTKTDVSSCFHCGEDCKDTHIHIDDKNFCCEGCKTVYQIINKVELCDYYTISEKPGLTQKRAPRKDQFAFMDDELVTAKLIHFKDKTQSHVTFYLPQMHCSSCIWLLEHLPKIDSGILSSPVNFLKKEVTVIFYHDKISLRQVAELLCSVGYEPHVSLNDISDKKIKSYDRTRIYKIGIAGFCFGNIMMLSFPEYFAFEGLEDPSMGKLFSYLNLILSLPVFFYSAGEFFISAWKGLQQKFLNIDAPIALAVVITFARSVYEILSGSGVGYLDSMAGIVFFMLIGRFFQDRTFSTISFSRDYTSYFPLGVTVISENGTETQVPVSKLKTGQRIKIHNNEIIPADSILFFGKASIDYSFVTGESLPVEKQIGEIVYAGGRQTEGALEMEVVKEVSQSYLTQLWNNEAFRSEPEEKKVSFIHKLSRQFTWILFSIAIVTAGFWFVNDTSRIWNAVTAILIVACPCALLLSATFTNGNMLRILQKFGFYARNANVLERIGEADVIVFDKTGTITLQRKATVSYEGDTLNADELQLIRSVVSQSSHPLSKAICASLPLSAKLKVKHFREEKGKGIRAVVGENIILLGSPDFILGKKESVFYGSRVYIRINDVIRGYYIVNTSYREGLGDLIARLREKFALALVSGDNDSEKAKLETIFGKRSVLMFDQDPQNKLNFIKSLQSGGRRVIMIGDGLNDAGALKQSDVGIAITDNINNFSPACDVIFDGSKFSLLDGLIQYCKREKLIILGSFIISVGYNIAGLYFAVQGKLEPVIAAILMPVSSISIVLFTTGMSSLLALKLKSKLKSKETD
jgi:Cu+-exporting ATPase